VCVSDVPGEPTGLLASDVQPTRVSLRWSAPRSDGGSRITAYRIERRDAVRTAWTSIGSVDGARTSYDVVNIAPGTDYWFRVFAENDVGASEPCAMAVPVRSKDKIGEHHTCCNSCKAFRTRILVIEYQRAGERCSKASGKQTPGQHFGHEAMVGCR
jgi:hypothetical protein